MAKLSQAKVGTTTYDVDAARFGTCSVGASTAAKTVTLTTGGIVSLVAGMRVTVKFNNANTAGTPTLNVNSLGAKNIYFNGAQITTGGEKELLKGTCNFIYDGSVWHLTGTPSYVTIRT